MRNIDAGKLLGRFGWILSVLAAMSLSTYSLAIVGHAMGLPYVLSYVTGLALDGAALSAGHVALSTNQAHGASAFGARLLMFSLAALSAIINSYHATLNHDPVIGHVFYASLPLVVLALFEVHSRHARRAALRRAGRVAQALPMFSAMAWFLIPIRTFKTVRGIVIARVDKVNGTAVSQVDRSDFTAAQVRAWAIAEGWTNIPERGRVHDEVWEAFLQAQNQNGQHSEVTS